MNNWQIALFDLCLGFFIIGGAFLLSEVVPDPVIHGFISVIVVLSMVVTVALISWGLGSAIRGVYVSWRG